jgi:AraC-like DNA-binding protein
LARLRDDERVRPNVEEAVFESAHGRPAPALRPYIAAYTGYRQTGDVPGMHRGLPSPYLTLIITIDDPVEIVCHPDPGQRPGRYETILGGLHASPAMIRHPGYQSGVSIMLSPLGARALLGLPAGEIASIDLEADDVLGSPARELRERVRADGTWAQRFAAIDDLLLRRLLLRRVVEAEPPAPVGYAWQRLLASAGTAGVAELAREIGWSERHLSGRFRTEIGLTPKQAARVIRFDRARRLVAATPDRSLARLAAECGYYDQAHLDRDFRQFAGCAPTRWLAEEFRIVQDGAAAAAEG